MSRKSKQKVEAIQCEADSPTTQDAQVAKETAQAPAAPEAKTRKQSYGAMLKAANDKRVARLKEKVHGK